MAQALRKPKTRAQSAAEINAAHTECIERVFKLGRTLIAAKRALPHGTFEKMIERDLPFTRSTAQLLMKIARDPKLQKAARVRLLPAALGTLDELARLPKSQFKQAVASGAIDTATTRAEAKIIRLKVSRHEPPPTPTRTATVKARHYTQPIVVPYYVDADER